MTALTTPTAGGGLKLPTIGRHILTTLAYVVGIIVIWQVYVVVAKVPPFLLPQPAAVWEATVEIAKSGQLGANLAYTSRNIVLGFIAGVVIGMLLGYILWASRWVREILAPYIVLFQAMPKIALAPLLVLWFGLGLPSQLALILMLSFFPMMVSMQLGLTSTAGELTTLSRLLGMSKWRYFTTVQLPGAMPSLFAGAKISIVDAMTGAFLAEFIAAQEGLGFLMVLGSTSYNIPLLISAVLITVIIGLVGFVIISAAERIVLRWRTTS